MPDRPDTRSRWAATGLALVLVLIGAGAAAVAGAAFRLSFASLERLGRIVGYGDDAWLLPICLDVAVVVTTSVWVGLRRWLRPEVTGYAALLTAGGLVASIAGNATEHVLTTTRLAPSGVVIVLVAAVPAAVLGAVVHLVALTVGSVWGPDELEAEEPDELEDDGSDGDEEEPTPPDHALPPAQLTRANTDEELASDVREWHRWAVADSRRPFPSRDRVVERYGIGARRAGTVRELAGVGPGSVVVAGVGR